MIKRLKAELKLIQLNDRFEAQAKNFEEQLRLKDEQLAKSAQRNERLMAKARTSSEKTKSRTVVTTTDTQKKNSFCKIKTVQIKLIHQ